jgi:hypothetical protein
LLPHPYMLCLVRGLAARGFATDRREEMFVDD